MAGTRHPQRQRMKAAGMDNGIRAIVVVVVVVTVLM
jgi:hypothetical protein